MRRHSYKKLYCWNVEIAYLVGLFASDGCLINDERHLNITSKDAEIISIVQKILGMDVKVSNKISQYGAQAFSLQFSNVALYDFLVNLGLTPAKSKTIGPLNVPDQFYADFLRGYFDGDGTVYGYKDKRWPNSYMYYTGFVSASPVFLTWLQSRNSELIGVTLGKIKPGIRAATLTYAKTDSQKLYQYLYYNIEHPKLLRKHIKFTDFILTDPYARIAPVARVLELVDRPR